MGFEFGSVLCVGGGSSSLGESEVERRVREGLDAWRRSQRKVGARWRRALYVRRGFCGAVLYREPVELVENG